MCELGQSPVQAGQMRGRREASFVGLFVGLLGVLRRCARPDFGGDGSETLVLATLASRAVVVKDRRGVK